MGHAQIIGWGHCVPPAVLTNQDLTTVIDTSDEWITSRTGIRERRITHVDLSQLATLAAQRALACAGCTASQIDLIIVATASGDDLIPNVASKVQRLLGHSGAAAFDLNAACSGFLYALNTASTLISAGSYRRALVIGADRLSYYVDWSNRNVAALFGDGAGAVVLEACAEPLGVQGFTMGCDSDARDVLEVHHLGTDVDRSRFDGVYEIAFEGQEIFKRAVKGMGEATMEALARAGVAADQVDLIVPHQANLRIIETLAKRLHQPMDRVMVNIDRYGNTSAASVPIALSEALEQGRVQPGATLVSAAFGAGLTWASSVIRWGARVTPIAVCEQQLPPCEQSALALLQPAIALCHQRSSR